MTAAALVVLAVAAGLFAYRLAVGPSLADRVIALNGLVLVGMGAIATHAAHTGNGTFHVTGIPGVAAYEETDLMGYEPNTNTFHWYAVTNAGETHDHVAQASDGNKQQFIFTGTQEGKPFKEVIDLEIGKDEKSATGRAETFVDGASTSVMKLELRKS